MSVIPIWASVDRAPRYWDDQASKLVLDGLRRAQVGDDASRRETQRALHDFLLGAHRQHLERRLAYTHPEVAREWNSDESGHRYFPLIQMLADRLAVVFHRPPDTYLHTGDDVPLPETDPRVQQWRQDSEDIELSTTLAEIERQVLVLRQPHVQPCWRKGRMQWDVHSPYEIYIDQDPENPRELEGAPHVMIELPQPLDVIGSANQSLFMTWRRVDTRDQNGRITETRWESWLHDKGGNLKVNPLHPTNENGYGMHPICQWRIEDPPAGCYWLPPRKGWFHQQLSADMYLCDLDWILRFQAHSEAVAKGGSDIDTWRSGPGTIHRSENRDFSFEYVTPDPNITQLLEAFDAQLRLSAVTESLPPDAWTSNSSTRNLGAKQLEQHALKMRRERVVPHYIRALQKTFRIHKVVADYWADSGRQKYGDDIRLGVRLAPIPEAVDRFQDSQSTLQEIAAGLDNPVAVLQRRHGLTEPQAQIMYDKNRAITQGFEKTAPPPAAAGEGVQRPPSVRKGD